MCVTFITSSGKEMALDDEIYNKKNFKSGSIKLPKEK